MRGNKCEGVSCVVVVGGESAKVCLQVHKSLFPHAHSTSRTTHSSHILAQHNNNTQDRRVRLYDTTRNWALRKDVTTRMTRWTITGR